VLFGVEHRSVDCGEGASDLARALEPGFPYGRVLRALHGVDEVALDIVDAAVREDADIQLRPHSVVVTVLSVGALRGTADADEYCGYRREESVKWRLASVLDSRAILVRPTGGEHPLDPPLHQRRHRPPVDGENEGEPVCLF